MLIQKEEITPKDEENRILHTYKCENKNAK